MENEKSNSQKMESPLETKKDSNIGPVIGSIIIIILIILGGLYFWGYVIKNQKTETSSTITEQVEEQVNSEEISDPDIAEINNELNSSDIENIDAELNQIDAEIDAVLE